MGLGILFLLIPSLVCCSACFQDERNSLLDFKQGINFTYSREYQLKPLESWRGLNCCTWEGVACHPHTAHVITLDLSHFHYSIHWSEVRGGLFQLLHLEHLDLSNNYLDLSYNYFYPLSIPPQIGELRRLKYLRLSECGFTGRIPRELTKLQQLEHLDLSENDLYGAIPRELTKLQQLEHLDLSGNDLLGAIPREMGNISTLKFLDLSWNDGLQSNKLGEWITHLRGLEHLELSSMNLSVAGDTWLASLANLTALFMYDCGLSGEIPPFFANLSRLQQLGLQGNSFRGKIPAFLGALPLSWLDLSQNNLEGFIPSFSSGLSNLENLDLSSNKLNRLSSSEFKQIEWQHSAYSRQSLSPEWS